MHEEEKYVEVVRNWHNAADARGLSQLQRCHFNYQILNYILMIGCHGTKRKNAMTSVSLGLTGHLKQLLQLQV